MALSEELRKRLKLAVRSDAEGKELADAVDANTEKQGLEPAENVAALGTLTGTYNNASEPTGLEVDASVQVVADAVDAILAALKAAGIMVADEE